MIIGYIASNPAARSSLDIDRELTKLQTKLMSVPMAGEIVFRALPQVDLPELSDRLDDLKADVLHVSAHGSGRGIAISLLVDGQEHERELAADDFVQIVRGLQKRPKGIYLSACNGVDLAERLAREVSFVVANAGDVTNLAARTAAVTFYGALARGNSVRDAFKLARSMHKTMDPVSEPILFPRNHDSLRSLRLIRTPLIRARFVEVSDGRRAGQPDISDGDEIFDFEIEVVNCPPETTQVDLFTDDETFIQGVSQAKWEKRLCTVMRGGAPCSPILTADWVGIEGNCRLFAVGVLISGGAFTISTTLVRALRTCYEDRNVELDEKASRVVKSALALLEKEGEIHDDP